MSIRTTRHLLLAAVLVTSAALGFAQATRYNAGAYRTYEVSTFGPSYEAALKQAGLHAVRSAVGEFYGSDEMLLARSLLDRYLENYYDRFIAAQKVLSKRDSQGQVYVRVQVNVNAQALREDLRVKRFFYKPKRRPFVFVSVAETVDGQAVSGEPVSRGTTHEALDELLIRHEDNVITTGGANLDLTADADRLFDAREAAQRAAVEILITGQVDLTKTQERKIHFDDYTFYNAKAKLALIRVDDGQVVAEGTYDAQAGNVDPQAALRAASGRAVAKILQEVVPSFSESWERTMTDNVEFQVTVVGVSPLEASVVEERLQTELNGARVYRRSLFEDVAVFNLYYPPDRVARGERARIEKVLRDIVSPQLKITPTDSEKQIRAVSAS